MAATSAQNLATTAAIAADLAARHPDAMLPCPACGAEVKGANLEKHLAKVHDFERGSAAARVEFRGVDKRMFWICLLPQLAWMAVVPVFLVQVQPSAQVGGGVALAAMIIAAAPMVASYLGWFKGTVAIEGDALELKWCLGLLGARVRFPATVRTGTLFEVRQETINVGGAIEGWGPTHEADVGGYLELRGQNGTQVRLGSKRGPRLGKYWSLDDHATGGRRRWWDIDLEPADLVQVQYLLAERGMLRVKEG